jgi:hypothetical protein
MSRPSSFAKYHGNLLLNLAQLLSDDLALHVSVHPHLLLCRIAQALGVLDERPKVLESQLLVRSLDLLHPL